MDALERAIKTAEAEVEGHKQLELELLEKLEEAYRNKQSAEIRYESLIEAARLRPIHGVGEESARTHHNKGRGKKPGTISRNWLKTLGTLYRSQKDNKIASFEDMKKAHERSIGRTVDPSSVKDRIKYFKEQEPPIIIGDADEGFLITDEAIERLGLEDQCEARESQPPDHMNGHTAPPQQEEVGTMI